MTEKKPFTLVVAKDGTGSRMFRGGGNFKCRRNRSDAREKCLDSARTRHSRG